MNEETFAKMARAWLAVMRPGFDPSLHTVSDQHRAIVDDAKSMARGFWAMLKVAQEPVPVVAKPANNLPSTPPSAAKPTAEVDAPPTTVGALLKK